jgi:chromosome segregation ATPase
MENRNKQAEKEQQLAALDTREGQQMNKLEAVSTETHKAWKWVQEHQDEFEKEVYGPPLITCSVKDPRYTSVIESLLQPDDFLAITAQTDNDFNKLNRQLLGKPMSLAFVPLRKADGAVQRHPDIPSSELQRYGLDGYALDFIDGPETVLSMLASAKGLHKAAVSLTELNDEQYNTILATKKIVSFAAGRNNYTVRRRAEYGDAAVSTATRDVKAARYWVDRPVDVSARRELQTEIDTLQQEWQTLREPAGEIKERVKQLQAEVKTAEGEAVSRSHLIYIT